MSIESKPLQKAYASRPARAAAPRKVLFVTSEMSDYVQAGGLGEVSAALPRALGRHCDARVLIPGYRQVLEKHVAIEHVASLPAAGEIPECAIGAIKADDGLVVYVVLCPQLYDRPGTPYGDEAGVDVDVCAI